MKYVIVTGIPRAGTTLTAALLDSYSEAVCLSEPESHIELMQKGATAGEFAKLVKREFQLISNRIYGLKPVEDRRNIAGKVITNYFSSAKVGEPRQPVFVNTKRIIDQCVKVLAIKHNALYTSALKEIVDLNVFSIVAIIRNPIHVIMSWRSLDLPVSHGRLPVAEKYWPEIRCDDDSDIFSRHCNILENFFERYRLLEPLISILKYEDIIFQPNLVGKAIDIGVEFSPPQLVHQIKKHFPAQKEVLAIKNQLKARMSSKPMPSLVYFYPEINA